MLCGWHVQRLLHGLRLRQEHSGHLQHLTARGLAAPVLRSGVARVYRLAVCKGPNCAFNGANEVFHAAKQAVADRGLGARCLIAWGGCYGMCAFGPNLVVRVQEASGPADSLSSADFRLVGEAGEYLYPGMDPARARAIVEEHVGRDRPVSALLPANAPRR